MLESEAEPNASSADFFYSVKAPQPSSAEKRGCRSMVSQFHLAAQSNMQKAHDGEKSSNAKPLKCEVRYHARY